MIVKLLTEHQLEFLSLEGGCRGSSESTLVKMSNCWKSHAATQLVTDGQRDRLTHTCGSCNCITGPVDIRVARAHCLSMRLENIIMCLFGR